MKILHIIVSGSWAGTEKVTFAYLAGLAEKHSVAVVVKETFQFTKKFYQDKLPKNVEVISLKDPKDIDKTFKTIKQTLSFDPDIIHAHLSLGCKIAKKMKTESNIIVAHMHMRFYAIQFSEFDGLIAVSPWQLSDIPKWYQGHYKVIPNFNPELKLAPIKKLERFKKRAYIKSGEYIVGTVCRLHLEKGVDTLINAFIKANIPNSKLLIIGDGIHFDYFKKLASSHKNIYFMGFVNDAYQYMKVFDLYVSASRADSFGLSTLEAIEQNIPVLASDTFGSQDILRNNKDLLFKIADEDELSSKMMQMYSLYHKNICTNTTIDISQYDQNQSVQLLEKYYKEIVNFFSQKI